MPSQTALPSHLTRSERLLSRRNGSGYCPARAFEDLHILDALELSGSQQKAASFLAMHQSTVSRSLQLVQHEFELEPEQGGCVCRHGQNGTLEQLRFAYRAHRLMKGVLRIGTDGLHQPLLGVHRQLQLAPPRFRSVTDWVELVRLGLLDAAIVSSFGLEKPRQPGSLPRWTRIQVEPLGSLPLQLMASRPVVQGVLLPRRSVAPLLHQSLRREGYRLEVQPAACQDPAAWLKRLRDRQLALPLNAFLAGERWLRQHGLRSLSDQPPLSEQLWLLLPVGPVPGSRQAQQWIRRLRGLVAAANACVLPGACAS
jgi:hypothetical protein